MNYWEALVLAFIEGLTEFLPISSTGHLILTSAWLGISEEGFVKSFNIVIQSGAILSVLVLYWKRFLPNLEFYKKLFIAFFPAAVIGLLVKNHIDALLGSVLVVAVALILGGFVLIWSDKAFPDSQHQGKTIQNLNWIDCFKLGLIQCFAFIPGVSRSGATIVGGLYLGMQRKEAAEFSFFLAVPTLAGASLVKSLPILKSFEAHQIGLLLFGTFFSFVFALLAIRFFIGLVSRFGFKHFGYYRIFVGVLILISVYLGNSTQ
ncbi:MAG: undecaprenyl-diphosphate phosphatase [Proteobacteria bacterium]|nr:undecaprenyl-diphosphate phosphatase [Pseudomonadota bacterium]